MTASAKKLKHDCFSFPRPSARKTRDVFDMPKFALSEGNEFDPDDLTPTPTMQAVPKFALSDGNEFLPDDLTPTMRAVELPRKRLPLDMWSTDCESSRRSGRSSKRSVDVCQSTTSSVYRLLDLDSRDGSVFRDGSSDGTD